MTDIPEFTDVFIVGGGPAGLAASIALRARGFDVTVADPLVPPIDKTCGEGLMPDSLAALARLGITLDPAQCFPFRGIRFLGGGDNVEAGFPQGTGLGMRRTHLHETLVQRARDVGVRMLWGVPVRGLSSDGVVLEGRTVRARWIVGADGENSNVRRWAGLDHTGSQSFRYGFRRHYRVQPWSDCVEIYWGAGCQIYVTPIGPEEVCVVAISRDSHLRLSQALDRFPELAARLAGAIGTTPERGAVSASRRLERVYRGSVVLLGDASGSVDAITGEGLRLAFEQSLALAEAVARDDLSLYAAAHRRLARRPAFMAAMMLSLDSSAWLRRRTLRALSTQPRIFAAQLAMHVGAIGAGDFVRRSLIPLACSILMTLG